MQRTRNEASYDFIYIHIFITGRVRMYIFFIYRKMDSIWESTNCECQRAINIFNCFCTSNSMKEVLCLHREMCRTLKLRPGKFPDYYPKLKVITEILFLGN